MTENTQLTVIKDHLYSDLVKKEFQNVVGSQNVSAYISSAVLAVANDDSGNLQKCTPDSIVAAALQSAGLRLTVDPSLGQAYLVPYGKKATFIPGYRGLHTLAMRTGDYKYINVIKVYEGQEVEEEFPSGLHRKTGNRTGSRIKEYIGVFQRHDGFTKTVHMTVEEIEAHAKEHSKSFGWSDGPWKKHRQAMEEKTVLRALLKWADLDPAIQHYIDNEVIDGEVIPVQPTAPKQKRTEAQNLNELGFEGDVAQTFPPVSEDDSLTREYPDGKYPSAHVFVLDQCIMDGYFQDHEEAGRIMAQCVFQEKSIEDYCKYAKVVRAWLDSGLSETDAIREANRGNMPR